ncbi:MAG: glucose-1-phosphate thymidylyltransferase [Elusimicrobia bacterium]|nr:glucose-1-phosphate thymidylyltransferase [Elusimicrobiota bacterium]MBU2614602.1 glucose-1-phosphate thymidylyltransferase [Elusimicrobiota bacterium]
MSCVNVFEDKGFSKLLPIVYTRATFELRCGIDLLINKIERQYKGTTINLFCREYLADVLETKYSHSVNKCECSGDGSLFINGRALLNSQIPLKGPEEAGVTKDGSIVYIRLNKFNCEKINPEILLGSDPLAKLADIKKVEVTDIPMINYTWEVFQYNPGQLKIDYNSYTGGKGKIEGKVYEGSYLLNPSQIFIAKGASVYPGCVLNAEDGPIYIDEDAVLQPGAVIEGPHFTGRKSIIRIGAKIRTGSTIGEVCRVGGEVEDSIIQSYSNKQHDGFLGHGYLGSWCNLGACTNNSDLKNNYGNVKVYVEGKLMDSGSMFVGLTMGDHSKSGIGTTFNTGTVVGIMCNIYGEGLPPKFIPSFSWGGAKGMVEYKADKAIEVAEKVMGRRKVKITPEEKKLYSALYEMTKVEKTYAISSKE